MICGLSGLRFNAIYGVDNKHLLFKPKLSGDFCISYRQVPVVFYDISLYQKQSMLRVCCFCRVV